MTNILMGIAATSILSLIGVVWVMFNARVKAVEDSKVDKAGCIPRHDAISQSLARIEKQLDELDKKVDLVYNDSRAVREQDAAHRKGGY